MRSPGCAWPARAASGPPPSPRLSAGSAPRRARSRKRRAWPPPKEGGRSPRSPRRARRREYAAGRLRGARLLCLGAADYPPLLAAIDGAPPALWALGRAEALAGHAVAIVGTRNASALGARFASEMARALAKRGLRVASGLARGIDAAAHQGALDAAKGGAETAPTIAVLAGGVDHVYPPQNAALYEAIEAGGVILSEMPMGHRPAARHFPRRNRIVSGLSHGVLVVEGAERSGSMITARAAGDQGREAMAAPGHPFDPRAAGPNALIREGAPLIRGPEDLLEALGPRLALSVVESAAAFARTAPEPTLRFDPAETEEDGALAEEDRAMAEEIEPGEADAPLEARILARLSPTPIDLDALTRALGAPAGAVAAALATLELSGQALRHPGGRVSLAQTSDV